jgi:hypothetical protein
MDFDILKSHLLGVPINGVPDEIRGGVLSRMSSSPFSSNYPSSFLDCFSLDFLEPVVAKVGMEVKEER